VTHRPIRRNTRFTASLPTVSTQLTAIVGHALGLTG